MTHPANLPDLIISLSRDNVRLELLGDGVADRQAWTATYPIDALFLEDQLIEVFDRALSENPSLIDHFDQVRVVISDSHHLCMPGQYAEDERWIEIAGRYLRNRHGDQLIADEIATNTILAYNFPASALALIQEYYANARQHHLTSIIWNSIYQQISALPSPGQRLFFIVKGSTLVVLGESGRKLTFVKSYFVAGKEDLHYYIIACNKLIQPAENWHVTIDGEPSALKLGDVPDFRFHHTLSLPELRTLIATHGS